MSAKEPRAHANERRRTSFANSGRIAGMGISEDDYSEESGYRPLAPGANRMARVTFPSEPSESRNGPVKIYKMPKEAER